MSGPGAIAGGAGYGPPDASTALTVAMMAAVAKLGKEPPASTETVRLAKYRPAEWRRSPFMGFELYMVSAIAASGERMAILAVDEIDSAMARLGEPVTAWKAGTSGGVTYFVARPASYGGSTPVIEERAKPKLRIATIDGEPVAWKEDDA